MLYRAVPHSSAAIHRLSGVIDESEEDYLYPAAYFAPIALPDTLREALSLAVEIPYRGTLATIHS
ncbi:MAG: hypothetical protein WBG50_04485 [Desulfomonilaceae bacterium]